jgi:hypothetical protein
MKSVGSKMAPLARVLLTVLLLWLFALSCTAPEVNLDEEFSLHKGESVGIKGEGLQVKFVGVVEDSRCPRGVTCVWEGRVSCAVEITYNKSIYRIVLTQPGLSEQPAGTTFENYNIDLRVEPYPEAGKDITESEYLLFLKFSK